MSRLKNLGYTPMIFRIGKKQRARVALLELKEALISERYEECSDLIGKALALGASELQVGFLLEDPRRNPS